MKTIYIATAIDHETGDSFQENCYTDAQRALDRAKAMCDDLNTNLKINTQPSIVPIDLYEDNEPVIEYQPDADESFGEGTITSE